MYWTLFIEKTANYAMHSNYRNNLLFLFNMYVFKVALAFLDEFVAVI